MPKLTDTQLIILGNAAQRLDHGITEIADRAPFAKLLKAKLLVLVPHAVDLALWERDSDGNPFGLAVTPAGLEAIGVEPELATAEPASVTKPGRRKAKAASRSDARKRRPKAANPKAARKDAESVGPRAGSKLAIVISMLRHAKGATIEDLMKATDWQAHSVRGAISGALKTKLGLAVTSEKVGEKRIYRTQG